MACGKYFSNSKASDAPPGLPALCPSAKLNFHLQLHLIWGHLEVCLQCGHQERKAVTWLGVVTLTFTWSSDTNIDMAHALSQALL